MPHFPSSTILAATLAIAAVFGAPRGASGFDSGPWDGVPFDQSSGMPSHADARLAGAIALSLVHPHTIVVGRSGHSQTNRGPSGCQVNIGGLAIPSAGVINNLTMTANTVVNGDVITVCR